MCGLFQIMMSKLDAYQFICPHIYLVAQKMKLITENLLDQKVEVHVETVVNNVESKVQQMYHEAIENVQGQISLTVRDIGDVIKHELKKAINREIAHYMSPDKRALMNNATGLAQS